MATTLIIDPDEDSRAILAAMLTHHGHAALQARTPAEAIRLARARRPAVVISELGQPEAVDPGLRELLDGGGGPPTPLIVLTSRVTEGPGASRRGGVQALPGETLPPERRGAGSRGAHFVRYTRVAPSASNAMTS